MVLPPPQQWWLVLLPGCPPLPGLPVRSIFIYCVCCAAEPSLVWLLCSAAARTMAAPQSQPARPGPRLGETDFPPDCHYWEVFNTGLTACQH